ncbi:hypothetical protein DK45_4604 [Bordetella bronchiseptica]|nr:hypothetical protein DK45_4604 [Bordetella bronchiseptica]
MITALLSDEEYSRLQQLLIDNPERGDLLRGGGGIRKMRYGRQGTGKRGGIRVIYYWISQDCQIYMLAAYAKSKKINLTPDEIAALRELVKEL